MGEVSIGAPHGIVLFTTILLHQGQTVILLICFFFVPPQFLPGQATSLITLLLSTSGLGICASARTVRVSIPENSELAFSTLMAIRAFPVAQSTWVLTNSRLLHL